MAARPCRWQGALPNDAREFGGRGAAGSPSRPAITGVSHIAVYTSAPAKTERFYVHDLGGVKGDDPENPQGVRYYFARAQFVEVLPLPQGPASINRLDHVAFVTADAEGLRKYLAANKVSVPGGSMSQPKPLSQGRDGSRWFDVTDPEGNKIEFVQPPAQPAEVAVNTLSAHIIHVGFIVHNRALEDGLFRTGLGFKPYWSGGMKDDVPTWISQQVPDGTDWLEYMIVGTPDTKGIPPAMKAADLGVLDHFSLGVPNIEAAYTLLWNGDRLEGQTNVPKIGRDAKWQLNLIDPDGTRAEIMELHAIGKPCCSPFTAADPTTAGDLHLNSQDYFESQGLSVIACQNLFHPVFRDQKLGGIEIILHGERIATDGEVRLEPTPEQWDPVPTLASRKHGAAPDQVICASGYPDQGLGYRLEVTAEGEGFRVAVHLDKPLPAALVGKAGFNLDFLPTSYFGKSYMLDSGFGIFPRHPDGPMERGETPTIASTAATTAAPHTPDPLPLATGHKIVLAPEDPSTRVSITSDEGTLMLFDARNRAQNGWFVVRGLIPADRTENALVWHIHPNVIPGWVRPPVVSYNQLGYTPERSKVAILELDPLYKAPAAAQVVRLDAEGGQKEVFAAAIKPWGKWLRYQYATFDFSAVHEPGVYAIKYGDQTTKPFRVAADVYKKGVWQPTLDTYLAVQMDHIKVRENYRVWHGVSHMDDARQAPTNYTHFDGYSMGATSDSPFASGQHIPGLNVGGWYDAGDYDIRTQTQARVITDLVEAREAFHLDWDETTIDEDARLVQIRRPDGVPDVLQQIKHGVLGLMAQYGAFGHAIPGIIEPTLEEYTHLGDAASKTDGKIYDPNLKPVESDGVHSGMPDDRWAFTTHVTALNYDAAAALAAASRVLKGYDDALASKALKTAVAVWADEHSHPAAVFHSFNTTGGDLDDEEVRAAVELLLATQGGAPYKQRLQALLPTIQKHYPNLCAVVVQAVPFMDSGFKKALAEATTKVKTLVETELGKNPFGVPIATGTWGGAEGAVAFAVGGYYLHQAFPNIIGTDYTLRGFDYVLGRHPASNVSYVSAVGTSSKLIGYGNNRADYTFIPGGMIPGVVIIQPDFPELKSDWPFLWYENEYVVDAATTFILAANAADALSH